MVRVIVLRRTAAALAALAATAAVMAAPAPLAHTAAPALAQGPATCVPLELDDLDAEQARTYAEGVEFVFVARVLDRRRLGGDRTRGEAGDGSDAPTDRVAPARFEHTVTIVSALRGEVENVVTVVTDTSRPDGFGKLRTRSEYLFFANEVDTDRGGALTESRRFEVAACSGTTRLKDALGTGLERELRQVLAPPESPGVVVELTEPAGGVGDPPSLSRAVAPGIALGLVGILGLLLLSRLGRRV